mgnify:CR=1 FL=1
MLTYTLWQLLNVTLLTLLASVCIYVLLSDDLLPLNLNIVWFAFELHLKLLQYGLDFMINDV